MRKLPDLQELNSLPVERDLVQSSDASGDQNPTGTDVNNHPPRIDEEDGEDEDTHNDSVVHRNKLQ